MKVTTPPGSGRLIGLAVLMTVIVGSASMIVTVALSVSVVELFSSSLAVAVTVSEYGVPGEPLESDVLLIETAVPTLSG